jgi:hypothetical protein
MRVNPAAESRSIPFRQASPHLTCKASSFSSAPKRQAALPRSPFGSTFGAAGTPDRQLRSIRLGEYRQPDIFSPSLVLPSWSALRPTPPDVRRSGNGYCVIADRLVA